MTTSGSYNPPNTGTGSDSLPTIQPAEPGLWLDNGELTVWDGLVNKKIDDTKTTEQWETNNW